MQDLKTKYETTVFRCRPLFCFKTKIRSYAVRLTTKDRVSIIIFFKKEIGNRNVKNDPEKRCLILCSFYFQIFNPLKGESTDFHL